MGEVDWLAGVDEAGRGPLAGPVCAAAVVLDPERPISGLADSKQLREAERERLGDLIQTRSLSWALGWASVAEIDELNILQASLLAMRRAVVGLARCPRLVLVDGNHCPPLPCEARPVVGGDRTVAAISAASILAKVARDRLMRDLDHQYPGYGFARHKGYPTRVHLQALASLGVTPIHRRGYAPVRRLLEAQ